MRLRNFFFGGSSEKAMNPRSRLPSHTSYGSIYAPIKVPEPPIVPFFKPNDYVEVLAQIYEKLESCSSQEYSNLFLLQYQVFKSLGDVRLMHRSLQEAWNKADTFHEKIIFGAWLKYGRQGEESIEDLLMTCATCVKEFEPIEAETYLPTEVNESFQERMTNENHISEHVTFKVGNEEIICDRQKISELSAPFHAMLKGYFSESFSQMVDLSENNISPLGMRAISHFSFTSSLIEVPPNILLEIFDFADKYCCERLKHACERKLASLVSSTDAVEFIEYARDVNSAFLVATCLQVILRDLPNCLNDKRVVDLFIHADRQQLTDMVGPCFFLLFCFLSEVSLNLSSNSETTVLLLERLVDFAENDKQKQLALHQLGCVRLLRKEYGEARFLFEEAVNAGHIYSIVGLARLDRINGEKHLSYEKLSAVISPVGWLYQERSLYCDDLNLKWEDLNKATDLDPTLIYPYMYRAASFMRTQNAEAALAEINRILGFKLSLECLEIRFIIYLALEDYKAALCDVQTILTLHSDYRMFEGRVAASHLLTLVREHVEHWTKADCWARLYECWSEVDDIGSLSVIYQMLESDIAKGVLYFRQYMILQRLNCPKAATRSLWLARQHASSKDEQLVYEGWILYETCHYDKALQKAEESISIKRSFEAFFLKAYTLAVSSQDSSCFSTVCSLLEDAMKCPSDFLRKGQALDNLAGVYLDYGKVDLAADCYINALKIGNTRAHQGLAGIHYLRDDISAAYMEMTFFIEKAKYKASAYETRSRYGHTEQAISDLKMATRLDPLRVHPYRYRALVWEELMSYDEAIAELSRAIAFKAHVDLLQQRAMFHILIEDFSSALRDCRAALSLDPNHQEILEFYSYYMTEYLPRVHLEGSEP